MELPQIGKHCFLSTCKELDFLPLQCDGCRRHFCRHHISPDIHQCEDDRANLKSGNNIEGFATTETKRCTLESCKNPSLDAYTTSESACHQCGGSYCAYHRYPESHGCNGQHKSTEITSKTQTARALLQRNFPARLSTKNAPLARARGGNPPSNPTRLVQYQKAELIKMRHRAAPGNPKDQAASVPLQERLHIRVPTPEKEEIFWFRKTCIAGRVLDQLASILNFPSATQLAWLKGDEPIPIRNDWLLVDQVEDGCTVVLIP